MLIVFYNTIMSLAAGVGLLLVTALGFKLHRRTTIVAEGWSLSFAILGTILTVLGFVMSITWPYRVPGAADGNILFGEPSIAFGLLLLATAFYLWHRRAVFLQVGSVNKAEARSALELLVSTVKPVSLFVFGVGLMMTACATSWIRYRLGAAPPSEPISGLFSNMPVLESTFMGVLYGLVALGALLFPLFIFRRNGVVLRIIAFCWILSGLIFLFFGGLNYYTHIGDVVNATSGTHYRY